MLQITLSVTGYGHPNTIDSTPVPSERSLPRELVRSAYAPSALEAATVLASIQEAQLEIEELAQNISDLQETIKQLEVRRACAQTYARFQQSLLAPIRKLPSEVLTEIFLHCIPRVTISGPVENSTLQLAGVSFYWRNILKNLRVLWSSLHIDLKATKGVSVSLDRAKSAVCMAIGRSGDSPLRFHISAPFRPAMTTTDIISALYPHRRRWECVSLHVPLQEILENMSPVRNEVPALRSLRIHSNRRVAECPIIDAFEIAPQLTQLYLGGFNSILSSLKLPWAQIRYFRSYINRIWFENICEIFNAMSHLEEFESVWDHIFYESNGVVNIRTPVHFPKLRSLSLANFVSGLPVLLAAIVAPQLEELILDCNPPKDHVMESLSSSSVSGASKYKFDCLALLTGIHDFVTSSSCTLKTMVIDGVTCAFIRQMLDLYPQIHRLTFFRPKDPLIFIAYNSGESDPISLQYEREGPPLLESIGLPDEHRLNVLFSFSQPITGGRQIVELRVRHRDKAERRAVVGKSAWDLWST